jgi:hypothetical protein
VVKQFYKVHLPVNQVNSTCKRALPRLDVLNLLCSLGRISGGGPFGHGRGKEGQEQAIDNGN